MPQLQSSVHRCQCVRHSAHVGSQQWCIRGIALHGCHCCIQARHQLRVHAGRQPKLHRLLTSSADSRVMDRTTARHVCAHDVPWSTGLCCRGALTMYELCGSIACATRPLFVSARDSSSQRIWQSTLQRRVVTRRAHAESSQQSDHKTRLMLHNVVMPRCTSARCIRAACKYSSVLCTATSCTIAACGMLCLVKLALCHAQLCCFL